MSCINLQHSYPTVSETWGITSAANTSNRLQFSIFPRIFEDLQVWVSKAFLVSLLGQLWTIGRFTRLLPISLYLSRTCSSLHVMLRSYIPVLVLVVFSLDQEILKWLSICPKYSRKLPKSFFTTEKIRKQKHGPKIGKMFSFLSGWHKKNRDERQVEKYRLGSLFQVESGKVDLSECTKLSVDERLVAPDPDFRWVMPWWKKFSVS